MPEHSPLLLEEKFSEDEEDVKITFTNRRIGLKIGRTIKDSDKKYEFTKFDLSVEADIPDGVDRQEASTLLFRELMEESVMRETAIRAARNNSEQIDGIVTLLQELLRMSKQENQENGGNHV